MILSFRPTEAKHGEVKAVSSTEKYVLQFPCHWQFVWKCTLVWPIKANENLVLLSPNLLTWISAPFEFFPGWQKFFPSLSPFLPN